MFEGINKNKPFKSRIINGKLLTKKEYGRRHRIVRSKKAIPAGFLCEDGCGRKYVDLSCDDRLES